LQPPLIPPLKGSMSEGRKTKAPKGDCNKPIDLSKEPLLNQSRKTKAPKGDCNSLLDGWAH